MLHVGVFANAAIAIATYQIFVTLGISFQRVGPALGGPMVPSGNHAEAYLPTNELGTGMFGGRAVVKVWLTNGDECPSVSAYAIWYQVVPGSQGQ
jgi:hypothetical protein